MEAEVSSAEDLEDDFKVVEGETEIVIKEVNTPAIDAAEDLVRITDDKEDIPVNDEEAVSSCASNGSQSSGNRRRANIVVNTSSRRASGGQTCGRSRGGRSSLPPSISQYSSSSEDSSSMKEVVQVQVRRRKKRKRPLGETERRSRQKSVRIEEALRTGDKDKLSQLAVSDGGLLTDEVRVRVWPRLLGINMLETVTVLPGEEELSTHPEYNQVVLDVNRSLKRFPPGIEEAERPLLQDQLTRLIVRVLVAQPTLHYYQGYHDVAITFLLVVGEHIGYQIMEKLSVSHLSKFMAPNMEQTMSLLQLMYPIIRLSNPSLHSHLVQAELGTIFALPWLITWFGHVLPDYSDVVRLYDFFLAGPPLMPVYLATAIVLHRQEEILATECEMSAVHGLLAKIPVNLPFESLLVNCQQLYEKFPPYKVEREAELDLARQKEERMSGRVVPVVPVKTYKQVLARIVIYSAPVLLGVVVWRVCMQG